MADTADVFGSTKKYIQELNKRAGGKEIGLLEKLKGGAKKYGPGVLGYIILEQLLKSRNQSLDREVQSEALRGQAELATPENLYYQASLPQAQQEEEAARSALFQNLSGGVLGPSLVRGERRIGS